MGDAHNFLNRPGEHLSLSTLLGYVEKQPDSLIILDREWRIVYTNERARADIAEYVAATGAELCDWMRVSRSTVFDERCRAELRSANPRGFELRIDPLQRWYDVQVTPLDGCVALCFRDISNRKAAEEALCAAEERYRLAAKATKDLIWDCDLLTDKLCWSEALGSFGYHEHDRITKIDWWKERVHPADRAQVIGEFEEAIRSGDDRWASEYRFMRGDGSYVLVQDCGYIIRNGQGVPARMVGAMYDMTGDREARAELARTRWLSQSVANAASVNIQSINPDGTIIYAHSFRKGVSEESTGQGVLGSCWYGLVPEESRERARAAVERAIVTREEQRLSLRHSDAEGSDRWFEVTITPVPVAGELNLMITSLDVTALRQVETRLREAQSLHQSILEASADCIMILGCEGDIKLVNEPGLRILGVAESCAVEGQTWSAMWPPVAQPIVESAIRQACQGEVARFSDCCSTPAGTFKWLDVVLTPMTDDTGEVVRLLAISRDVSHARQQAEDARWASEHDALTSLPNRRSFQARLQAATLKAMGSGGTVGLLLIDLDHFKHVNDTLGHAAGDHLLDTFGQRLATCVRSSDFIARLGGDEFAVIIENIDHADELIRIGDAILNQLQTPIAFEGRVIGAGASIGGAMFPADAATAVELFKCADIALYALKDQGRGGMRMFHSHMREEAQLQASQLSLARAALRDRLVVPFYQPKIDLASGAVVGFEALLRWVHPHRGIQLPDSIGAAFQEYDLASRLGEIMYSQVFVDLVAWREAGVDVGRVSINAAPAEFLRDNYAERLLAALGEAGVAPSSIEVEVTEQVFINRGADYVSRALGVLTREGVRISLDDFGTGYSSLSHLRDFPVDVVKIDRSFVARADEDSEIGAIVTAVINLAASLSIGVVAEGIETEGQRDYLIERGCQMGQGYLFGRPMRAAEVEDCLGRGVVKLLTGARTKRIRTRRANAA